MEAARKPKRQTRARDITGQRFGQLTALRATDARDAKGNVVWRCRCDCGKETDISYNVLLYTNVISCGCRRQAHNQAINRYLTHVDGTSLEMLKSERIPKNNTTGVKGVYRFRGKAAQARREGEEAINRTVVAYYQKWEERAKADPDWAKENPVRLLVSRTGTGGVALTCLPEIE